MALFLIRKEKKQISYYTYTNPGDREVNEDSVGVSVNGEKFCFILCDGLGGHGMGDVASSKAVEVIDYQFLHSDSTNDFIKTAFPAANDIILVEQTKNRAENKMKTTGVIAVIADDKVKIAHIGDSRCYVFDHKNSYIRTLDHSVPQMMVISKQIKEEEIRNHADRNVVLKALGSKHDGEILFDIMKPISINKVNALLLASDGFWELITEDIMIRMLNNSSSPEEWVKKMVLEIKSNGKEVDMDNFSAIAVFVR